MPARYGRKREAPAPPAYYEEKPWIWFENTASMRDRTAAGVAVGIIFGIFKSDDGWKIAQRAAETMRLYYDDFPQVPVQYLE